MMQWGSFAKQKNGEWDGLNNAAIYSFNSNIINSFVREMFQNSIDARDKNLSVDQTTGKRPPLKIRINYKEISHEEFPEFEAFKGILKQISSSEPNKQHVKFFDNAFNALGNDREIPLFIYEDFNTYGLTGSDDDPNKSFNACVVSEGISIKAEATSGGSFGIGKNAIYGLSKLRTVFYSSLNVQGEYIFQGKAKLASYYDDENRTHDNKIYFGSGESYQSVRKFEDLEVPNRELFRRDEPGLSQYAVCPVTNDSWQDEFAKAILRNYWMLLEKGELIVELQQQDELIYELSQTKLDEYMLKFFDPSTYSPESVSPKGNPWEYYRCYKDGNLAPIGKLDPLGEVRFYYREIDNKSTNAIAYLRNNMVVYAESVWGFGSIGYCGVFMCDDDTGNQILKAMEPPTHDSFDPDRLEEKLEGFESADGERILRKIKELAKNSLQEIMDKYRKPVEDIPWLDNLLSSITGAAGVGEGSRSNEESETETTEKIGKDVKKTLNFNSIQRNTVINDLDGEGDGGGGGSRDPGPRPGPRPGPGPGPNPGPGPGTEPVKHVRIKSRIFRTAETKILGSRVLSVYQVHLGSTEEISATDLLISQQGDSGNVAMFRVAEAKLQDGQAIQFSEELNSQFETTAYRLKEVRIPCVLSLVVDEPHKSSFKIVKS